MSSSNQNQIKSFYRQRKKSGGGGITKAKSPASSSKTKTTLGSDVTQPPALLNASSPDLQGIYVYLSTSDLGFCGGI